jgi:hypothetical protein
MFPLPRNAVNFAVAGAIVVAAFTTSASGYEMVQKTGPVGPYEPILTTVGNKHVIAFFVPEDDHCNLQMVMWNADDVQAHSAGGVRLSLKPGQAFLVDSSATETFTLKCGDYAESLAELDGNNQVVSK